MGQPVGIDAVGGQRWIMLKAMLAWCGVNIDQVQQYPTRLERRAGDDRREVSFRYGCSISTTCR